MALCNDASYAENGMTLGDPTETALADYLGKEKYAALRKQFPRENELPFDSTRKMMSTLNLINDKKILYTKGAIDALLPRVKYICAGAEIRPISQEDIEKLIGIISDFMDMKKETNK